MLKSGGFLRPIYYQLTLFTIYMSLPAFIRLRFSYAKKRKTAD